MNLGKRYVSAKKWMKLSLALSCLHGSITYGRDISLPFELNLDADNYQDLVVVTGGATHQWVSNGGWNGGAAKFTPNNLAANEYMALRGLMFMNDPQERINVRFLVKFGSVWNPGDGQVKMTIVNRPDPADMDNPDAIARERPILALQNLSDGNPPYRTLCAAGGGGYRCHDGTNTAPWPNGNDPFKLIPPTLRVGEWISVELEATTLPGDPVKVYVYTQDGEVAYGQGNPYATYDLVNHGRPLRYVDLIGAYNNGMAPNADPNNYYMIDEVRIDTHYIGPPEGFLDGGEPALPLTENSYVSLNPRLVSASVISLADNNVITAGDQTLRLDLYELGAFQKTGERAITPGMVISGTGPFALGSETRVTDTPVHASMRGRQFVMPQVRGNHTYHMISPQGRANVTILLEGTPFTHSLLPGEVFDYETGEVNSNAGAVITSDVPILVSHTALATWGAADASPVPPAGGELWGICSGASYVSAAVDGTQVTIYSSTGSTRGVTLNAGERRSICPSLPSSERNQGRGPAIHLVADRPVGAVQIADGDGGEQTAFYPTSLLNSRFGIPKASQYIAIACPSADTQVTLYRPNGSPVTRNCSANGNRPGKVLFGNPDAAGAHIARGSYIESTHPVYVIYEETVSNGERNLIGTGAM